MSGLQRQADEPSATGELPKAAATLGQEAPEVPARTELNTAELGTGTGIGTGTGTETGAAQRNSSNSSSNSSGETCSSSETSEPDESEPDETADTSEPSTSRRAADSSQSAAASQATGASDTLPATLTSAGEREPAKVVAPLVDKSALKAEGSSAGGVEVGGGGGGGERIKLAVSLENVSEQQEVLRDPSKRITSDNKQRELDLVAQYEKLNVTARTSSSSIEEDNA